MAPMNLKRTAAGALTTLILAGMLTACGNGSSCSPAALGSIQGQAVAAISVAAPEDAQMNGGGGGHGSGHSSGGHADGAGHGSTSHDPATGSGVRPRSTTPFLPFVGGHGSQCPTSPTAKP